MRHLFAPVKLLALALLLAHLAAVSVPCPGESRAEGAARDHHAAGSQPHTMTAAPQHEMPGHHPRDCADDQPAGLYAPCLCGCGGHSGAATSSSARLGYALLPALNAESPNPFRSQTEPPIAGVPLAAVNSVDHIPISFLSA